MTVTLDDLAREYGITSDADQAALLKLGDACIRICGEPSEARIRQVLDAASHSDPGWMMPAALLWCDMIWRGPDGQLTALPMTGADHG